MNEKAILLEYSNEYGEWAFYAVFKGATPKQALEYYATDHECEAPVYEERKDAWYLDEDCARAYEINITTL